MLRVHVRVAVGDDENPVMAFSKEDFAVSGTEGDSYDYAADLRGAAAAALEVLEEATESMRKQAGAVAGVTGTGPADES